MVLAQHFVFVDTETTGLSVTRDRIIEIGMLRVENGKVVKKFQSLVNPEKFLSPFITSLTHITSQQLEEAPTFREISHDIKQFLTDAIFVAHNVRFDYAFFKNEFKRLDTEFSTKHFCTAKLSRSLFPQERHHNLDSIIERFGITCNKRHRAFDDAKVLWDFYKVLKKQFGDDILQAYIKNALKRPSLPLHLAEDFLDKLPETPGVYTFFGENNTPLYVGKSINVKERVFSHFSSDHTVSKEMHLSQQVKDIHVFQTSGELGALLKEAQLIKQLQPLYNRKLREARRIIVLKNTTNKEGYYSYFLEEISSISPEETGEILGTFKSKKQAKEYLAQLVKQHALCEKLVGIEKAKGACFGYRLGLCKGACVGKENSHVYNARCIIAFSQNKIKPWPFKGPIFITEENVLENTRDTFCIDKWCLLGKQSSKEGLSDFYTSDDYRFDMDTYKILVRFLEDKKNWKKIKQQSVY